MKLRHFYNPAVSLLKSHIGVTLLSHNVLTIAQNQTMESAAQFHGLHVGNHFVTRHPFETICYSYRRCLGLGSDHSGAVKRW